MKALKKQFQKPDGCSGQKCEGFGYAPASPPAHARAPRQSEIYEKSSWQVEAQWNHWKNNGKSKDFQWHINEIIGKSIFAIENQWEIVEKQWKKLKPWEIQLIINENSMKPLENQWRIREK